MIDRIRVFGIGTKDGHEKGDLHHIETAERTGMSKEHALGWFMRNLFTDQEDQGSEMVVLTDEHDRIVGIAVNDEFREEYGSEGVSYIVDELAAGFKDRETEIDYDQRRRDAVANMDFEPRTHLMVSLARAMSHATSVVELEAMANAWRIMFGALDRSTVPLFIDSNAIDECVPSRWMLKRWNNGEFQSPFDSVHIRSWTMLQYVQHIRDYLIGRKSITG